MHISFFQTGVDNFEIEQKKNKQTNKQTKKHAIFFYCREKYPLKSRGSCLFHYCIIIEVQLLPWFGTKRFIMNVPDVGHTWLCAISWKLMWDLIKKYKMTFLCCSFNHWVLLRFLLENSWYKLLVYHRANKEINNNNNNNNNNNFKCNYFNVLLLG